MHQNWDTIAANCWFLMHSLRFWIQKFSHTLRALITKPPTLKIVSTPMLRHRSQSIIIIRIIIIYGTYSSQISMTQNHAYRWYESKKYDPHTTFIWNAYDSFCSVSLHSYIIRHHNHIVMSNPERYYYVCAIIMYSMCIPSTVYSILGCTLFLRLLHSWHHWSWTQSGFLHCTL